MTDTKLTPLQPTGKAVVPAAPVAPVAPVVAPKPRYLVVKLGEQVSASQKAFADAFAAGYTTLESVYVVTAPSGAGTAFAIFST
jgi:hypothetical protein